MPIRNIQIVEEEHKIISNSEIIDSNIEADEN